MPKKRHKPEEIVAKLRQVDVMVSQGQSVADAVRAIGVTEVTYYRWRQEFGGGCVAWIGSRTHSANAAPLV
jgi:putative transposase